MHCRRAWDAAYTSSSFQQPGPRRVRSMLLEWQHSQEPCHFLKVLPGRANQELVRMGCHDSQRLRVEASFLKSATEALHLPGLGETYPAMTQFDVESVAELNVSAWSPSHVASDLQVTFLNVGQGLPCLEPLAQEDVEVLLKA